MLIGPLDRTFVMWRKLFDAGVFTNPVTAPAVPITQCRLRTSLMATHSFDQIDYCLNLRPDWTRAGGYLTQPVLVRAVGDARALNQFIDLPYRLHARDPSGSRRCVGM